MVQTHINATMTGLGDDCYFFYYSTCTKGDACPFRHCEAAMGNETVCSLWREGRCFRAVCKFRHMEIMKNRKEIPCYWEKQPAGCQKPHCAFFHEKPRYNEGEFIPPNKGMNMIEEQQQEEPATPQPTPLPTTANPQLRGVIKTETQELVPSPTHPPVVINPADDDEDEDDQFSEDGEDGRLGPSPRKLHKSDDSLNIGVSTLEEIRLRRALKASMRKAGYPLQSTEAKASGEKENIRSLFRPALFESRDDPSLSFDEAERPRGGVAARLGRKIPTSDVNRQGHLKRNLADRLGGVVDVECPSEPPKKTFKPVRERLGLFSGPAAPSKQADTNEAPQKVPEHIRIKTLEEIRKEKSTKGQHQTQRAPALRPTPEITITRTGSVKGAKHNKRSITVQDSSISNAKTFSKTLRAKQKRQEEEPNQSPSPKKARSAAESQEPSNAATPPQETADVGEIRVKTLEEIRREKAARLQVQQVTEANGKKSSDSEEETTKRPRLLRLQKLPGTGKVTSEKAAEETVRTVKPAAAASEAAVAVKVKSFEEIMREKRMRKQEEQTKGAVSEDSPQNRTPAASLKRRLPAKVTVTSAGSPTAPVPESSEENAAPKPAVKSESSSPLAAATEASVPVKLSSSPQTPDTKSPRKNTRSSSAQSRAAPQDPLGEAADMLTSKHPVDTKVRPKLNVKPSVMKPAVQLKPGQKRKGVERSAVAAVKPLNSSSRVQATACKDSPAEVAFSPEAQLGVTSTPLREKLQTVSISKKSQSQESKPAAGEPCAVPQSPVLKSPTQSRSRRPSLVASRSSSSTAATASSAVDDFDDLINEFTGDHLEDDMDPGIGEDDLLQELSEMIGS